MGETTFTTPSDREIEVTRVFDAPQERVFEVWTTCEHVAAWSGPEGWDLAGCDVDARTGGSFRYVWRRPDGLEVPSEGTYEEFVPPERIATVVPTFGAPTRTVLTLTEADGKTTMTYRVGYPSTPIRDAALAPEMKDGMIRGYDRLEQHLSTLA